MKVSDLQVKQAVDSLELEITEVGETQTWSNANGNGTRCSAKGKDDSGEIAMTLWNQDVGKVKVGDKILIENGWVTEYKNEKQVGTGRFGKLTVL